MAHEKVIYDIDGTTQGSWLTYADTIDCGNGTMLDEKLDDLENNSGNVPYIAQTLTGDATPTLENGKFYDFTGSPSSITPTLTSPASGVLAIYAFQFTVADATVFSLELPDGVSWGNIPEFETNGTYQVTVMNNVALYCEA